MATAAQLTEELPERQRRLAEAMLAGQVISARRGGKAILSRILTQRAAALGEHVHVLGR